MGCFKQLLHTVYALFDTPPPSLYILLVKRENNTATTYTCMIWHTYMYNHVHVYVYMLYAYIHNNSLAVNSRNIPAPPLRE